MLNATSEPATTVPSASASSPGCSTVSNSLRLSGVPQPATSFAEPCASTSASTAASLPQGLTTADFIDWIDRTYREHVIARMVASFTSRSLSDVEAEEAWQGFILGVYEAGRVPEDYNGLPHFYPSMIRYVSGAARIVVRKRQNAWGFGANASHRIESYHELDALGNEQLATLVVARSTYRPEDQDLGRSGEILKDLMDHLTKQQRTIFTLRYGQDMTNQEIGDLVGLDAKQVFRIQRTAGMRIRRRVQSRGYPEGVA